MVHTRLATATIFVFQFFHSRSLAFMSTSHLPLQSSDRTSISPLLVSPLRSSNSSSESTSISASTETSQAPNSLYLHHTAIKTRNIETAIKFYSLFGFEIEHKFRAGPARAAWLTNSYFTNDDDEEVDDEGINKEMIKGQNDVASRIELIEVPAYMLNEKENTIKRAIDLVQNESLLGLNHYALDVTSYIHFLEQSNVLSTVEQSKK